MAAVKEKRKSEKFVIVEGKKFPYQCKCKLHGIDCVPQEAWDAVSFSLYRKKKK